MSAILFTGASEVVTCTAATSDIVMKDAAVLVKDGLVHAVGPAERIAADEPDAVRVDCSGCVIWRQHPATACRVPACRTKGWFAHIRA
jgi:imidazolonepropionase-like amidohydrolase